MADDASARPRTLRRTMTADEVLVRIPALARRAREHGELALTRADVELRRRMAMLPPLPIAQAPAQARTKSVHFSEEAPEVIPAPGIEEEEEAAEAAADRISYHDIALEEHAP